MNRDAELQRMAFEVQQAVAYKLASGIAGKALIIANELAQLQAENKKLKEFAQIIENWPFNIEGDCVADAKRLAKRTLKEVKDG